jgi:hypothetical protein
MWVRIKVCIELCIELYMEVNTVLRMDVGMEVVTRRWVWGGNVGGAVVRFDGEPPKRDERGARRR